MLESIPTRRLRLATLGVLTACLVFAATTGSARAAVGDLTFSNCVGNLAGCAPTNPATAVNDVLGIAITPDGRNLYAAARQPGVVDHFTLNSAGDPTFAGCVGTLAGCTSSGVVSGALNGAVSVAVTHDGKHLYVGGSSAVSHLSLDTAGNPAFVNCVGNLAGCTAPAPASAVANALSLAITPNNAHLYVGSSSGDVAHLTLNASGNPTFAGCIGPLAGCTPTNPPPPSLAPSSSMSPFRLTAATCTALRKTPGTSATSPSPPTAV